MKTFVCLALMGLFGFGAFALTLASPGDFKDCTISLPVSVEDYSDWETVDQNGDGKVDYAASYAKKKKDVLIAEAMDFNNDGRMDDFYFYENGTLVRREVDSNYDGSIDLWVYMDDGVYITAWERDVDYDGTIDKVKDYSLIKKAGS